VYGVGVNRMEAVVVVVVVVMVVVMDTKLVVQ
jgi:hypothetical protein